MAMHSNIWPAYALLCLFSYGGLAANPPADQAEAALDAVILRAMNVTHTPSIQAAIVKNGELVWHSEYGTALIDEPMVPATQQTIYSIASVTKTVTAVAILQLWEKGLVDLDADVSTYLPFEVVHPVYPDIPITLRALASHVAAIDDTMWWREFGEGGPVGGDPMSLAFALRNYLQPGGFLYSHDNFALYPPNGTKFAYSNVGVGLIGLAVQTVAKVEFTKYCQDNIFSPLGMDQTFWFFRDMYKLKVHYNQMAEPYTYKTMPDSDQSNGQGNSEHAYWQPRGFYDYPETPAGCLKTSATQLASFLAAIACGGTVDGFQLLKPESIAELHRVQYPEVVGGMGFIWMYHSIRDQFGDPADSTDASAQATLPIAQQPFGHQGSDEGLSASMWFIEEGEDAGTGYVILSNGDKNSLMIDDGGSFLETKLREFARTLAAPAGKCGMRAQSGERCGGFNEMTGLPFAACTHGLICKHTAEASIPGADSTCVHDPATASDGEEHSNHTVKETMTSAQMAVSFPIAMILFCLSMVGTGFGLRSLTLSEDDPDKQSEHNVEHSPLTP